MLARQLSGQAMCRVVQNYLSQAWFFQKPMHPLVTIMTLPYGYMYSHSARGFTSISVNPNSSKTYHSYFKSKVLGCRKCSKSYLEGDLNLICLFFHTSVFASRGIRQDHKIKAMSELTGLWDLSSKVITWSWHLVQSGLLCSTCLLRG